MAKTFGDFLQISPVPTDFLVGYRGSTEARTTVDSLCTSLGIGDFISNVTTTNQNSAKWSSAYTTLNANSALYQQGGSTNTTLNAGSANWNSTYTSLKAASGGYDAATALVNTYNSSWILQSGNNFGGTPTPMVIGNLTNEGLSLITNGTSRLDIANTGGITINGGANATMVTTKLLTADFTNPQEFVSRRYVDSLAFQTTVSGNFVSGLYYTKTQTNDLVTSAVAPGNSVYSTVWSNSAYWADTRNNTVFAKSLSTTETSGVWNYLGGRVVEGSSSNKASGSYSHAEGQGTSASGNTSHAEGIGSIASGGISHAEGYFSSARGDGSHAEGGSTLASGNYSHAQGVNSIASGYASHAEGQNSTARGTTSHAGGSYAEAAHNRTWIWKGSTDTGTLSTTRTDQFLVSAAGGIFFPGNVGIGTDNNTNALTVAGSISGSGGVDVVSVSARSLDLVHLPASDGIDPVLRIGEYDTATAGNAGFSGMFMSYNETTNTFGISAQFAPAAGIPAININRRGMVGIGTDTPTENLTVAANISAANIVYALGGNSNQWNTAYTNLVSNSANYLSGASVSYVNANFLPLSGGRLTGLLTSTDGISGNGIITALGGNSNQWNSVYTNVNANSALYGFIAAVLYS